MRMTIAALDRKKTGELLAISAFVLYVAGELLFRYARFTVTYPTLAALKPLDICECVAMALAIAAIAARPRTWTTWQALLAAGSLAALLYSSARTGDFILVHGFVLLIAIAGIRLERLCTIYSATVICILIAVIMLSTIGLLYNRDIIPNSRLVFSYGFGHPNAVGAYLFAAIGTMAYACWEKRIWWVPLLLAIVAAVFSYATLSSHGAATVLILLALATAAGHITRLKRLIDIPKLGFFLIAIIVPFALLAIMLACAAWYDADNSMFAFLNRHLHGRPYYAHEYFMEHGGFTHLGRPYSPDASSYHSGLPFSSVDSGFCRLPLVAGLFAMYALIATYITAVWHYSCENRHFLVLAILIICSLHLMLESYQLYIATSAGALFLSSAFAEKGNLKTS